MEERLFAATTPGLEPVLGRELEALGLTPRVVPGGAEVSGPPGTHRRLNVWLRTATRVLLRLGDARAPAAFGRLDLSRVRRPGQAVAVEGPVRLREEASRRWPGQGEPLTLVVNSAGEVSVDTSGEPLFRRGWRQEIGRAPMRETLAAGMLALAGFDPSKPLWDVMCGSGTLLIEAAQWGKPPGAKRPFAFQGFPGAVGAELAKLPGPVLAPGTAALVGTDLNAGALGIARRNARRAGVLERLTLERLDATKLVARPGLEPGLLLANLPYGKRAGEPGDLRPLYRALGARLRAQLPGWRFAFLLEDHQEALGLAFDGEVALDNGGLACRLCLGTVPPGT